MTLIALAVAIAPLVWATVCIAQWRSGPYRELLVGGLVVSTAGVGLLVTGPALQSVFWLSPIVDTAGAMMVAVGWFWIPEGVFMAVAGVVIRLIVGRADSQR